MARVERSGADALTCVEDGVGLKRTLDIPTSMDEDEVLGILMILFLASCMTGVLCAAFRTLRVDELDEELV